MSDHTNSTSTRNVCDKCEYNLPAHGFGCPDAPRALPYCPDHAGDRARGRGSDDMRLTCTTCGVNGQHVSYYLAD